MCWCSCGQAAWERPWPEHTEGPGTRRGPPCVAPGFPATGRLPSGFTWDKPPSPRTVPHLTDGRGLEAQLRPQRGLQWGTHLLVLLRLLPPPPPLQGLPLGPRAHHGVQRLPQHQVPVVEAPHACSGRPTGGEDAGREQGPASRPLRPLPLTRRPSASACTMVTRESLCRSCQLSGPSVLSPEVCRPHLWVNEGGVPFLVNTHE